VYSFVLNIFIHAALLPVFALRVYRSIEHIFENFEDDIYFVYISTWKGVLNYCT